jgi:hypothetical protein
MGLDDLGSIAAEMRERVRTRRETFAKAEAESAAWLERLASVAHEDDTDWRSTGSAPVTGRPMPAPAAVSPFGWLQSPAASELAAQKSADLERLVGLLSHRNDDLALDVAALQAELSNLRMRHDALVNQVSALRSAQQRRSVGQVADADLGRTEGAAVPREWRMTPGVTAEHPNLGRPQ